VVTLTIDGGAPVTTTADAAGNWIYTPQGLADGVHTVVASETGGNIAEASLTFTLYSPPTITSVVVSGAATQTITTGQTIAITLDVSHPVNVAAPPLLLLNDCATATYDATLSTPTALVFDYTVGSHQRTGDLTVSGIELASPGSITDVAGNLADLTGAGASLGLGVNGGATGVAGPSHGFVPIYGTSDVELFGPSRCRVKFESGSIGMLRLDDSAQFTGSVAGLATGNSLDLADIAFGANTTLGYAPNAFNTGGTLSVTDGSQTANITLFGHYSAASFAMSNDGGGHVLITDPPPRA
jgi:hypothetical protein